MKLTILNLLCVASLVSLSAGQQCNSRGLKKFDSDMATLLTIANSGRKFPTSKGEPLKKWCDESERLVNNMELYKNKCLKEQVKQTIGVVIFAVKNAMKQYCKKDSQKLTELINAVPCVTANDRFITKCYTNLIDGIQGSQNAEINQRIPHLCCEYVKIFQCLDEKLTKRPSCNSKHVVAVSDLIRGIIGNVVDLICGDFTEESDKCQSLGPAPKKLKSQKRTRSFAIPVVELLASIP